MLGLGLNMIVGRGRGDAEPAKELTGTRRERQPVGVASLLHLWAAPLVAGRHIAPQLVEEAMRPQCLQRAHDGVTRTPQLQHEEVYRRV